MTRPARLLRASQALPALKALAAATVTWTLLGASSAHAEKTPAEPEVLPIKGGSEAYYYAPSGKGLKPVIMYLHGRGGHPKEDCKKWSRVARDFGWVVCPQGPEDRGGGARSWANNPEAARQILDAAVTGLRAKYKGRVQTRNNILIGFSEGAFVAQQVGLKDSQKWSKWLILAASDRYWMGDTKKDLDEARQKLRRVYLLTGENDGVAQNTNRAGDMLRSAKVPVRVNIVKGMGHEVPSDKMITNYRRPLMWLTSK